MSAGSPQLVVILTTLPTLEAAEAFAKASLAAGVVCAQVDSELRSFYVWRGVEQCATEHRVVLKVLPERLEAVRAWATQAHPYETPQWIELGAAGVGEKYLQWAQGIA